MNSIQLIAYLINLAIPALAVYLLFTMDHLKSADNRTIAVCLGWGTTGAFAISLALNNNVFLPRVGFENLTQFVAPVHEEIWKALILIYFIAQPRFRYAVDGAIYGFAAGIGFSVTENFYKLGIASNAIPSLADAISLVLSTSLMHATTSAVVGISLGRWRRTRGRQRVALVVVGFLIAVLFHMIFNNAVALLQGRGAILLLVGFGIGVGGAAIIAYQISQVLRDEKKRFEQVLTVGASGVTRNELRAIQSMGDDALESILSELGEIFGKDTLPPIRRLFALQANIGILKNNLSNPCSDRLRSAWEGEIVAARQQMDDIRRRQLGVNVMLYLRNVFPSEDAQGDVARAFVERVADNDPTHVHRFDLFIVGSERAGTIPPDELERIAVTLQQAEFFRDLKLDDLENLSRAAVTREFAGGAILFRQGDRGDEMFLIQSGEIAIVVPQGDAEKLINVRRTGEIVGDLALLDGYPRSATARAQGPVKTLTIRRDSFLAFLRSRPQVMLAILTFLSRSVRYTTEIIETSVLWATHIARGDYVGAQKLGYTGDMPLTSPTARSQDAPAPAITATQTTAALQTEFDGVSAASPALLRGMFAKATQALEERDSAGKLTGMLKSADNKTSITGKHKVNLFASGKTPPEQTGADA